MVKGLNNADIVGVTSEHNPTLHLWLLSLFIMTGSVAWLFFVASVFALNILGIAVFLAAAIGSLWAIKSVIDRMKWY